MLKIIASLLSPGGPRASLSILVYHRVLAQPDPLRPGEVDATTFDWQMRIAAEKFNVLPLGEAVEKLRNGSLPARAMCVTFDDGYEDNYHTALPILQRWQIPATFFIATSFLDGGCMWNDAIIEALHYASTDSLDLTGLGLGRFPLGSQMDRRKAVNELLTRLKHLPQAERADTTSAIVEETKVDLPHDLMMHSDQVRALHNAGMEIGGHTVTHPILTSLNHDAAYSEIAEGKEYLENLTRSPVRLFAYPNGKPGQDYGIEHVGMVKKLGFSAAVSTAVGVSRSGSDLFQLARFTPWDKSPTRFSLRLLANYRGGDPATV